MVALRLLVLLVLVLVLVLVLLAVAAAVVAAAVVAAGIGGPTRVIRTLEPPSAAGACAGAALRQVPVGGGQ